MIEEFTNNPDQELFRQIFINLKSSDENVFDLVKKIDYYLSHDDERKSIAANGSKIVKEKYTSSAIVKTLLHKIESILE